MKKKYCLLYFLFFVFIWYNSNLIYKSIYHYLYKIIIELFSFIENIYWKYLLRKRCCIASETVHTAKTSGSSLASRIRFSFPKKMCVAGLKSMQQVRFQPSSLLVSGGRGDTVTRCVLVMKPSPSLGFISTFKARLKWLRAPFIPRLLLIQTVWLLEQRKLQLFCPKCGWNMLGNSNSSWIWWHHPEFYWPLSLGFLGLHRSNYWHFVCRAHCNPSWSPPGYRIKNRGFSLLLWFAAFNKACHWSCFQLSCLCCLNPRH